jgi:hypothetical protein
MGNHGVFAFNFYSGDPADWDLARKNLTEFFNFRDLFFGSFTTLTPYVEDTLAFTAPGLRGSDILGCVAWQFHREELGRGLVQAFRREQCGLEFMTVKLKGLLRSRQYVVTDQDGGSPFEISGDELMDKGLKIELPHPMTAKLITFKLK